MAITLQAVSNTAKTLIREATSDTFSDATMQAHIIACYFDWCRELKWPEGIASLNTYTPVGATMTAQEYQLPDDIIKIFRVYLNGQRCSQTSIFLLEGDVIQAYDPTWRVLPTITVPQLTGPTVQAIPITSGSSFGELSYYTRGAMLGFVPGPASDGYPIRLEGAFLPPTPNPSDLLALPDQWQYGLAYGGIYRALLGDRRLAEAKMWKELEQEQWAMAMRWRRDFPGLDQIPMVQPQGYRTWYGRTNAGLQDVSNGLVWPWIGGS